ncbi:hypothetical protein Mgra_00001035 [Meloidogyne graminicola]|uniref:Uncharacterized protein n=1 Tax=Meloidogyne graminicola TaxID=189291 RepID=A0A8T0A0I4_9BILA|nr:hypothetical protein Mgra_00001035 [Meloidogyne graminicola]
MSNVEKLDDDEYDMHLSSLTVGEFFQRVETEGRLNEFYLLRLCGKKCSLHIWSEGKELNREERMEEFINNNALISVKQYRIKSAIKPYFNKGAVALQYTIRKVHALFYINTYDYTCGSGCLFIFGDKMPNDINII